MFIQNKYYIYYYNIIHLAKSRINLTSTYFEKHHIIPKSLGGSNLKENSVMLSAREHFICHLLLVKITSGDNKRKMSFALNMMLAKNKNQCRKVKLTSRIYEMIKKSFSNSMKELWEDESFRIDQSNKHKEYWNDSANRIKASERSKKVWQDENLKLQASIRAKSHWNDPNKRKAQSDLQKQLHLDDPSIGKKKSNPGELNGMYGKTHNNKVKKKLGKLAKERFKDKTYEEIYGLEKAEKLKKDKSNKLKMFIKNNPGCRSAGNNSRALKSLIISPDGKQFEINGTLKEFCKEHGLSFDGMRKTRITGKETLGRNAGWKIFLI